jgi:RNA polymerase sigma factor (sigma-70 family)
MALQDPEKNGAQADFEEWLTTHRDEVRRVAYGMCHDSMVADDLTQQVSMKLWASPAVRAGEVANMDAYARTSVRRAWYSHLERTRNTSGDTPLDALPELSAASEMRGRPLPMDDVATRVESDEFWQDIFARVGRKRGGVLLLTYHGFDDREIAERLDLKRANVRVDRARALERLRESPPEARPEPAMPGRS